MQDGHTSNKNQEIEKGDAWDSVKLAPAISNSSIYVLQNQNLIYSRYIKIYWYGRYMPICSDVIVKLVAKMCKGKALEPASATKTFLDICLAAARKACSAASPGLTARRSQDCQETQNSSVRTSYEIDWDSMRPTLSRSMNIILANPSTSMNWYLLYSTTLLVSNDTWCTTRVKYTGNIGQYWHCWLKNNSGQPSLAVKISYLGPPAFPIFVTE